MATTPVPSRIAERKLRDKEARRANIISAARRIAELEGWPSVTVRRLSDEISYSQPVLYAHFGSREGVLAAIAIEGFRELGLAMEQARKQVKRGSAVKSIADAYLKFAASSPALYEAMFSLSLSIPFGQRLLLQNCDSHFPRFWSCLRGRARDQKFSPSSFGRLSTASPSLQEPSDFRPAVRRSA
jgi:AcrR family transcriptional regulator